MPVPMVHHASNSEQQIAENNRRRLREAGVFTVNIIGAAGCGKTTLIAQTLDRLVLSLRVGVVACDPATCRDADRLARCAEQTIQVDTGEGRLLEAAHLREVLARLDLARLDLLLIENISSIVGPAERDVGEDAKVGVFSVDEGDDKADKYADLVSRSEVLILNKMDLAGSLPFNRVAFEADVRRLNPRSPLLELSALTEGGLDAWLDWLKARAIRRPEDFCQSSLWLG